MSKHTPTPWHIDEPYFIYIWGPEQQMVADLPFTDEEVYLARVRGVGRGATEEERRANAEFIVRACNSHKNLLEACISTVESSLTDNDTCCYCGRDIHVCEAGPGCPMHTARLAIAKAGGP